MAKLRIINDTAEREITHMQEYNRLTVHQIRADSVHPPNSGIAP